MAPAPSRPSSPSAGPGLLTRLNTTFWALLDPWIFLSLSLSYLPQTIISLIRQRRFLALLGGPLLSDDFQSAWFGHFWSWAGPQVRSTAEVNVVPLLEGRVRNGEVVPKSEAHAPGVGGVVLEIGPGSGMWVSLFSDEKYLNSSSFPEEQGETPEGEEGHEEEEGLSASWATIPDDQKPHHRETRTTQKKTTTTAVGTRQRITQVYGVEPNYGIHPLLQHNITQAGLSQTYTILPFGIEDIERYAPQIQPESLDCIVSILCLCSIPEPQKNIGILYRYLKPGGRWFVYEHVKCCSNKPGGWFMSAYQAFVNLFWPLCLGGCQLRRDTARYLKEAGPWTDIDLAQPPKEQWHQTVPHIYGILTK
ncbi:S-adenosyl-L-methionine-dependent methyltransferase [Sordaria brevicollis]|uniref:S-adenosyl-L-methionine-dependent methyltransferase n=1 Tax=Sordaria brevicollis TaxID=83679 RepID=A0AAE0U5V5_SORBR|nr:S-adenosyl-L-methionine-dependent methyltransferase [Sordaria brevicollis]